MNISINIISKTINLDLKECIESIVHNQFPKEKYIIVLVYEYDHPARRKELENYLQKLRVNFHFQEIEKGQGIAFNRNQCIKISKTKYVLLVDSDCTVSRNWIPHMSQAMESSPPEVAAIVGDVSTKKSNFLGECIALLGFPGGGKLGFNNVFGVDGQGYTTHLSHGNCLIKKEKAEEVNYFEEFVPKKNKKGLGQTDKYFAYKLRKKGYKIKYVPDTPVFHPPYNQIFQFLKRNFAKGKLGYWYLKKTKETKTVGKSRLNALKQIIKKSRWKLPFTLTLLFLSYCCELSGYLYSVWKN